MHTLRKPTLFINFDLCWSVAFVCCGLILRFYAWFQCCCFSCWKVLDPRLHFFSGKKLCSPTKVFPFISIWSFNNFQFQYTDAKNVWIFFSQLSPGASEGPSSSFMHHFGIPYLFIGVGHEVVLPSECTMMIFSLLKLSGCVELSFSKAWRLSFWTLSALLLSIYTAFYWIRVFSLPGCNRCHQDCYIFAIGLGLQFTPRDSKLNLYFRNPCKGEASQIEFDSLIGKTIGTFSGPKLYPQSQKWAVWKNISSRACLGPRPKPCNSG